MNVVGLALRIYAEIKRIADKDLTKAEKNIKRILKEVIKVEDSQT